MRANPRSTVRKKGIGCDVRGSVFVGSRKWGGNAECTIFHRDYGSTSLEFRKEFQSYFFGGGIEYRKL